MPLCTGLRRRAGTASWLIERSRFQFESTGTRGGGQLIGGRAAAAWMSAFDPHEFPETRMIAQGVEIRDRVEVNAVGLALAHGFA